MKSMEMTYLFHGMDGERWMRCFYDMSMRCACQISGVSTSALKRIRDKKGLPTWPFQGMKGGGEVNAMKWEAVRRHRAAVLELEGLPHVVKNVLIQARDWGRIQRRIHDSHREAPKADEIPAFEERRAEEWAYLYPGDAGDELGLDEGSCVY
jgi:hypothetical protein